MSAESLPPPVPALFPERAARERVDGWLTRELLDADARIVCGSVVPTIDMAQFRRELAAFDFETPRSLDEVLAWTIRQLEHGLVHLNHPRYFGLFNPAANYPAQCADRIAAVLNPQLASSGTSPVGVAIESHVIRALAGRAGLPEDAGGHFTTSGSEANCEALICALTRVEPRFGIEGVQAFRAPVAIYASRDSHPAWLKIAHQCGIGRAAFHAVATDELGRMRSEALAEAVAQDRLAGVVPALIVATAGTSMAGMIDPLTRCADIAAEAGVWYHVDAAWGGAALASGRLRRLLTGIERADSITIDAHKWFATTMGCGMFLTRHPTVLSEAFRVTTDFMPSTESSIDPYLNSVQWSRRFMGLRLFLSLAAAGWEGYAAHIERAVQLIGHVRDRLIERGWSVINDSELAVLCVTPPEGSPPVREIARRVLASHHAWVAATHLGGRDVIRICATHGASDLADAQALLEELAAALR
jgi:glutamate/tyrosine decarboxylase-like PLP-dependent enzyme